MSKDEMVPHCPQSEGSNPSALAENASVVESGSQRSRPQLAI